MQEVFEKIKEKCLKDSRIGRSSLVAFLEIVDKVAEEYNNDWIPVSERLPDEDADYLITARNIETKKIVITSSRYYGRNYRGEGIWEADAFDYEILAWQALPEPYQYEGSDR